MGRSSSPGIIKNFRFSTSSRPALGPPSLISRGYWKLFPPGVKRQRRESDHSPPTSAEVKKTWISTTTSPSVFMAYFLSGGTTLYSAGFEVIKAGTVKNAVSWDVTPCGFIITRRFGGTCRLHLQSRRNNASYHLALFLDCVISSLP
jgi:hypothetical protein